MLAKAIDALVNDARNLESSDADLNRSAQTFLNAVQKSSLADANAAIRTLSEHFKLENPARGAFLALVCGALIEHNCDPTTVAGPLTEQLESLLKLSAEFTDSCLAKLKETDLGQADDQQEMFEKTRKQLANQMKQHSAAWEALQVFWRPAIAVYSLSSESRSTATHLREYAAKISDFHEAGHWLTQILDVLESEPILVIEPHTGKGIIGRISGVVDNFQLNVLLMDCFPKSGFLARRRVARPIVDVARGTGPQTSEHTVTGVWNLYTWQAIQPGNKLPDPKDFESREHWVWNEGTPSDIPVFEGHRTILLGPASYSRSWRSQRTFDKLAANLDIERQLSKAESNEWLNRMVTANRGS